MVMKAIMNKKILLEIEKKARKKILFLVFKFVSIEEAQVCKLIYICHIHTYIIYYYNTLVGITT